MKTHTTLKKSSQYKEALRIMQSPDGDVEHAKQLLREAVESGDPYASYALGTWYFGGSNGIKKNKKKGLGLWKIAAAEKVPEALFDLAVFYESGDGIAKDLKRAFLLYMDAAIRGDKQSIFEVGRCYFFGIGVSRDKKIAKIWFQRAKEIGTFA